MDIRESLEALKSYAYGPQPIENIVLGVNKAKSDMQKRVFNSETGSKDVTGSGLGGYSNPYAQKRANEGRQARVVDLEFTGTLRRSFKVEIVNDTVSIIVDNPNEVKKLGYIEQNYKRKIFDLSQEEEKDMLDLINKLFAEDITEILNS